MSTKPINNRLTKLQARAMDFMRAYFAENDQLPPSEAMQAFFGWKSQNSVVEMRAVLARKGFIEKNACGKHRFARPPKDAP